jgi:proteasome lid subunit RPN8/RPN11
MISLNEQQIKAIEAHAERTYPNECGGMLLGSFGDDGKRTVAEIFPLENSSEEDQQNRVLLLPRDVLRAERRARETKVDVIGYYHSHPEDEAVPSRYDLDHALPVWSYTIVSVRNGKAVNVRSWQMEDDRSRFNEESIEKIKLAEEK